VAVRGELNGFHEPSGGWSDVYRTPTLRLAERA
jgi:hypothetical protein